MPPTLTTHASQGGKDYIILEFVKGEKVNP